MCKGRFVSFIEGAWLDSLDPCLKCLICTPFCPVLFVHMCVLGFFQGLCDCGSGDWCCTSCLPEERQFLVAVHQKDYTLMSEYLSKGANINSVVRLFTRKTTALLEAIKLNDLELIRFLLDHGADPNIEADDGPSGETPSQVATRSDNAEIQIMVQRAADYLAYARQHAAIASAVPPSIQEMTAPVSCLGLPLAHDSLGSLRQAKFQSYR